MVKKLLRAVPAKFLQIVSTMEQFGDLETMTVEEVVGSLKAHEERLNGQVESFLRELMLTEEEWAKKDNKSGKLLLTKEEWKRRMNKGGGTDARNRTERDKSQIKCHNCNIYGHYAVECRKPQRAKEIKHESRQEAHLSQTKDDEPALLMSKQDKQDESVMLNETEVAPKLKTGKN